MVQVTLLVEDILDSYTQVEGSYVLGYLCVPLPFRFAVASSVSFVADIGNVRNELELVFCGVSAFSKELGPKGVFVRPLVQGVA